MKKFVTVIMLLALFVSLFPGEVGAAVVPKLYLNGKQLQTTTEPQIVGQSTLVPIRTVTQGLGFDVEWSSPNVNISNGTTSMVLTIGSKTAVVNNSKVALGVPAISMKNTTMVPLRFVSENFGLDVFWDVVSKSVYLYQKVEPPSSGDGGNGSMDPGSGSGTGNGSDGNNGSGGSPTDPGSESPAAALKAVEFDGLASIYLPYNGEFGTVKTEVLHSPERIVVDLPNMNFDPTFTPAFTSNASAMLGEIVVDTHPSLQKIRYSYYSDKPSTVRVVLDLGAATNFQVSNEDHIVRIDLLDVTGPVVVPPPENPDKPGTGVFKVVLDAGHGAKDPGAYSVNGRHEKEYNLSVTLKVKALLDKEPRIKPYLTRSHDTFVELNDRAMFANDLKADLFISFHANSASSGTVSGSETYYNRANSKALADVLHKHLVAGTGLADRKVRQAGFVVIKKTTMPAVLLEAGYLSNKGDSSILFSDAKQNKIAEEIVKGIKEYLKLN
ncbi:N-acetylmuramoyl-L-alanine amidase [Paenibacillus solisilvae]|uniref:N-acetylmuramoyl-L-alanine amidase n=1 Tax=Paenibacillus solisilvae TaxID=2486751 RepID=A0ABW0W1Q1_9BACL